MSQILSDSKNGAQESAGETPSPDVSKLTEAIVRLSQLESKLAAKQATNTVVSTSDGVAEAKLAAERAAWVKEKQELLDAAATAKAKAAEATQAVPTPAAGQSNDELAAQHAKEKSKLQKDLTMAREEAETHKKQAAEAKKAVVASGGTPASDDPHWQHMIVQKSGPHYKLVICVLSSRAHKDRRDAIRDSWAENAKEKFPDVAVRFVVGEYGCPENQKGEWDCKVDTGDPNDTPNVELTKQLKKEAEEHGDMAMVDMVDSYRALPKKLRLFYRQLAETYNYDFVLKIDDDTYVNIERVLGHLKNDGIPLEQTWYGHMRCDWNRNEDGKWAELDYTASNYPCFGGGGGNVLSHDLSDWVGINAPHLKDYQGEDISMGIWLAGRVHKRISNDDFHTLGDCNPNVATMPEQGIEDIKKMHDQLVKCGNECKSC